MAGIGLGLVAVLLLAGLVVVLLAVRARRFGMRDGEAISASSALPIGVSVGTSLGAIFGAGVWLATGNSLAVAILIGAGMIIGLAVGLAIEDRFQSG